MNNYKGHMDKNKDWGGGKGVGEAENCTRTTIKFKRIFKNLKIK